MVTHLRMGMAAAYNCMKTMVSYTCMQGWRWHTPACRDDGSMQPRKDNSSVQPRKDNSNIYLRARMTAAYTCMRGWQKATLHRGPAPHYGGVGWHHHLADFTLLLCHLCNESIYLIVLVLYLSNSGIYLICFYHTHQTGQYTWFVFITLIKLANILGYSFFHLRDTWSYFQNLGILGKVWSSWEIQRKEEKAK